MAFLDAVKGLFGRKEDALNPPDTMWLADQLHTADGESEALLKPLPLIGRYAYSVQLGLVLAVLIATGVLFLALFIGVYLFSSHNAAMRSLATDMQVLSQRVVTASAAGMQGDEDGFDRLGDYVKRFDTNLFLMESESALWLNRCEEKTENFARIKQIWKENFANSESRPANMLHVIENKKQLQDIAKSVSQIGRNDKELSTAISVFGRVLPSYDEADHRTVVYAEQLNPLYLRMAKSASLLLSGETSARAVYELLVQDIRQMQLVLRVLREGDRALGVSALKSKGLLNALAEIERLSEPFNRVVGQLNTSSEVLDDAYRANRFLARDSELLVDLAGFLADYYEAQSRMTIGSVFLFILAGTSLFSLYLLVRVYNQEALRRRLQSEEENKSNQQAILRLLNDMADLADGDLTVRAMVTEDLTGAIADSINYTIEELRSLIIEINKATEQVTRVAGQAQLVSNELLEAAEKQSEEIENTNQTVSLIVQSVQGVSSSAAESSKVASASLMAAEQGAQAVNNQIKGMNEIREQIQETAKRIKRLGESSQEIGEIVELISDITEQTNVLALNAAIQAAAAGEAGRGFSVVAEEVQRLAERSGEATKQIAAIVKTIQADTHDAVAAMELSTRGVVEGAKLSDAAGAALAEIERVSRELARLIRSIAQETEDQTLLAERVNATMRDILGITEQTTRGAKSSAETVGQLTTLAAGLKSSISGFKI